MVTILVVKPRNSRLNSIILLNLSFCFNRFGTYLYPVITDNTKKEMESNVPPSWKEQNKGTSSLTSVPRFVESKSQE